MSAIRLLSVRIRILLPCLFLTAFVLLNEDPVSSSIAKLNKYIRALPPEKVYIHFDKSYYSAGETIWFKTYLFDGSTHDTDTLSQVVYVDFISNGKILAQKQLRPDEGTATGDWFLADTLKEGIYQIRAYTNWMRNFDEDFFFSKDIRVYHPDTKERQPTRISEQLDLTLFPEGGELVDEVECRVGVKAADQFGRGVDVEGFVLENEKDTVTAFKSEHLGLGRFQFVPHNGRSYTVVVSSKNSPMKRVPMPASKPKGQVLIVDNISNKDNIRVFVFNTATEESGKELSLVAQMRGQVVFAGKGSAAKKSFVANIPRTRMPADGILQITLFSAAGEPVAERLIFARNAGSQLKVAVKPSAATYAPREKVTLDLEVKDAAGKPVIGDFSLAVTDGGQVMAEPGTETLVSSLLMSSDLKGYIEQPGYYFDPENTNAFLHLDFLLMTQGWRRFTWQKVLREEIPEPQFLFERGLTLSGTVTRPNGRPLEKKEVNLTLMANEIGGQPVIDATQAEANGRFGFYNLILRDSVRVMVQAVAGKGDKNLKVTLDPGPRPAVRVTRIPFNPVEFNAEEFTRFMDRSADWLAIQRKMQLDKAKTLKEITVKAKKQEESDSRKIYGRADATVKFDQMMTSGAMSIFQVLQGRVAGVYITGSGMDYTVQIRGAVNFNGVVEPLFVLDGMPVDKALVATLPVADVDYVDILKGASAAIYGSRGAGGVISILTKRGGNSYDWSKEVIPGQVIAYRSGYTKVKEFYAPDYGSQAPENGRPDFRSTVYWNPSVRTDQNGKATVTFWNTDNRAMMRVQVEGTSGDGRVGAAGATYVVR